MSGTRGLDFEAGAGAGAGSASVIPASTPQEASTSKAKYKISSSLILGSVGYELSAYGVVTQDMIDATFDSYMRSSGYAERRLFIESCLDLNAFINARTGNHKEFLSALCVLTYSLIKIQDKSFIAAVSEIPPDQGLKELYHERFDLVSVTAGQFLSRHRCPEPTSNDLEKIASEVRVKAIEDAIERFSGSEEDLEAIRLFQEKWSWLREFFAGPSEEDWYRIKPDRHMMMWNILDSHGRLKSTSEAHLRFIGMKSAQDGFYRWKVELCIDAWIRSALEDRDYKICQRPHIASYEIFLEELRLKTEFMKQPFLKHQLRLAHKVSEAGVRVVAGAGAGAGAGDGDGASESSYLEGILLKEIQPFVGQLGFPLFQALLIGPDPIASFADVKRLILLARLDDGFIYDLRTNNALALALLQVKKQMRLLGESPGFILGLLVKAFPSKSLIERATAFLHKKKIPLLALLQCYGVVSTRPIFSLLENLVVDKEYLLIENNAHQLSSSRFQEEVWRVTKIFPTGEDCLIKIVSHPLLKHAERLILIGYCSSFTLANSSVYEAFYRLVQEEASFSNIQRFYREAQDRSRAKISPERSIEEMLGCFMALSEEVIEPISGARVASLKALYLSVLEHAKMIVETSDLKKLIQEAPRSRLDSGVDTLLLACIREQCRRVFGFYPYHSQMLNLILLIQNSRSVSQIKTGEGKSLIISMLANYLSSIQRETDRHPIHVITTTEDLAKRDVMDFSSFHKGLGVSISCACGRDEEPKVFASHIVYGLIHDFQFAQMRARIAGNLASADFSQAEVIVDEVDTVLDEAGNDTRLSVEFNDTDYQNLWKEILDFYRRHDVHSREYSGIALRNYLLESDNGYPSRRRSCKFSKFEIRAAEIVMVNRLPTPESLADFKGKYVYHDDDLFPTLYYATEHKLEKVANLRNPKVVKEFLAPMSPTRRHGHLIYSLNSDQAKALIPEYIRPDEADEWLAQVDMARSLKINKDYVIRDGKIVIVDQEHTGALRHGMRWDDAIHIFVELFNGLRPGSMQKVALSSNRVHFLNQYASFRGLTGTLGNEKDKEMMRSWFNLVFHYSARCRESRLTRASDVFVPKEAQLEVLSDLAVKVSSGEKPRPVLIIVQTIQEAHDLHAKIIALGKTAGDVQLYDALGEFPELTVARAGGPGIITVATNIGGRGADISLFEEAKQNGGLSVLISVNDQPGAMTARVREQAEGRAARQGSPGSVCYVINQDKMREDFSGLENLSRWREHIDQFGLGSLVSQKYIDLLAILEKVSSCVMEGMNTLPGVKVLSTDWPRYYTDWLKEARKPNITQALFLDKLAIDIYSMLSKLCVLPSRVFGISLSTDSTVMDYIKAHLERLKTHSHTVAGAGGGGAGQALVFERALGLVAATSPTSPTSPTGPTGPE